MITEPEYTTDPTGYMDSKLGPHLLAYLKCISGNLCPLVRMVRCSLKFHLVRVVRCSLKFHLALFVGEISDPQN